MKTPTIDFNPQQLLDPDVAELNLGTEMVEQRKLTRLVWRLEHRLLHPESLDKGLGELRLQAALLVEQTDILRAFPALYHNSFGACVQPLFSHADEMLDDVRSEGATMLLAHLELNAELAIGRKTNHFFGFHPHVRESGARFDVGHADVCA